MLTIILLLEYCTCFRPCTCVHGNENSLGIGLQKGTGTPRYGWNSKTLLISFFHLSDPYFSVACPKGLDVALEAKPSSVLTV